MSRVDEAMRRAAEGSKDEEPGVGLLSPLSDREAETFVSEASTEETPDRQPSQAEPASPPPEESGEVPN